MTFEREIASIEEHTMRTDPTYYAKVYSSTHDQNTTFNMIFQHYVNSRQPLVQLRGRLLGTTHGLFTYVIHRLLTNSNRPCIMFGCGSDFDRRQSAREFQREFEYALDQYSSRIHNAFSPFELTIQSDGKKVKLLHGETVLGSVIFFSMTSKDVLRGYSLSSEFVLDTPYRQFGSNNLKTILEENLKTVTDLVPLTGHRVTILQSGLGTLDKNLLEENSAVQYAHYVQFLHINPIEYQQRMLNRLGEEYFTQECLCSREVIDYEQRF